MNLQQVFSEKYLPNNLRIRSASTIRHYRVTLKDLNNYLGRAAELSDLNDDTIQAFARHLVDIGKVSAATINQRLNYVAALWRWCAKRRLVDQWPAFQRLDEPKIVPRAWTRRQLQTLMRVLSEQEGRIGSVAAAVWWTNLHRFMWEANGERIGACLQIEWHMLDRHACTVDVPAKIRKGQYRGMVYTISQELMKDLWRMHRGSPQYVFPWPHCEQTLYNRYKKILRKAGLPCDHRSKFHRMRRSFASHLKAAGGDPTYEMQHSSTRITLNCYLDPTIAGGEPSYRKLPRIDDFSQGE